LTYTTSNLYIIVCEQPKITLCENKMRTKKAKIASDIILSQ
jgi:hypothetical protein